MLSSRMPCAACKFLHRNVCLRHISHQTSPRSSRTFTMCSGQAMWQSCSMSSAPRSGRTPSTPSPLRDPIYGCVGFISILQQRLKLLEIDLASVRKELATYFGPQAMLPLLQPPPPMAYVHHQEYQFLVPAVNNLQCTMSFNGNHPTVAHHGGGQMVIQDQSSNQMLEMKQMMEAKEQQQCHVYDNSQISSNVSPIGSILGLGIFDAESYQVEQQPDHHHHPLHNQLQPPQLMGQSIPGMTKHHQQLQPQPQQLQQCVQISGSEEASNGY